jgi:hypothetical protein
VILAHRTGPMQSEEFRPSGNERGSYCASPTSAELTRLQKSLLIPSRTTEADLMKPGSGPVLSAAGQGGSGFRGMRIHLIPECRS